MMSQAWGQLKWGSNISCSPEPPRAQKGVVRKRFQECDLPPRSHEVSALNSLVPSAGSENIREHFGGAVGMQGVLYRA